MKHYITGYRQREDEQIFKIQIRLELADLRKIMQWNDDGECVFDNELHAKHVAQIEHKCHIELPKNLVLYLTTESE
jgi:hypothetical protein